jgi:hypothetical protein
LADLNDLYRILYFVYKANYEGDRITVLDLQGNDDKLSTMHIVGKLHPSLFYLRKANYVEGPDDSGKLDPPTNGISDVSNYVSPIYPNYTR